MKKENQMMPDINVRKLPNGYAFRYEGEEFMAFTPMMLVAEVMARVGSGQTKEMDNGSLLHCLFEVMLGQQYAKDVDKLKQTASKLEHDYNERIIKLDKQISILDDAIAKYETMKKQLDETTELTNKMAEGYQKAYEPYNEYNKRILKLERDTMRIESHFKDATTQASTLLKEIELTLKSSQQDERLLTARVSQLVAKLERRVKEEKNQTQKESPAADATTPVVEHSADEGGYKPDKSEKTNTKEKKPAKTSVPKQKGKGSRNKAADEKIIEIIKHKANENPNILT